MIQSRSDAVKTTNGQHGQVGCGAALFRSNASTLGHYDFADVEDAPAGGFKKRGVYCCVAGVLSEKTFRTFWHLGAVRKNREKEYTPLVHSNKFG